MRGRGEQGDIAMRPQDDRRSINFASRNCPLFALNPDWGGACKRCQWLPFLAAMQSQVTLGSALCLSLLTTASQARRAPRQLDADSARRDNFHSSARRCSSVVEQRIRNARVVGSIPTTGSPNSRPQRYA